MVFRSFWSSLLSGMPRSADGRAALLTLRQVLCLDFVLEHGGSRVQGAPLPGAVAGLALPRGLPCANTYSRMGGGQAEEGLG